MGGGWLPVLGGRADESELPLLPLRLLGHGAPLPPVHLHNVREPCTIVQAINQHTRFRRCGS